MDVWRTKRWKRYVKTENRRTGLRVRYQKGVHPEVKRACNDFVKWLRKEYEFPIRVRIYVKTSKYIKALDGEMVDATCFQPFSFEDEPYIKISTGFFEEDTLNQDQDSALRSILLLIIHELTHYYQWINCLEMTERGEERQAHNYEDKIFWEYADDLEHL